MQEDDWLDRMQWLSDLEAEGETPPEEPAEKPEKARRKRPGRPSSGASSGGLAGLIGVLSPWQRFVLALLLFLNVALLGCMCLVMTGRVVPFSP
jgi:hypothetical protein